jgi:hypothetical protein
MPRVSFSNDHGDNGHMETTPQKREVSDVLEFRGYITERVLVLAGNRNNCVFFSPDDAIPEYNFIPNLLKELGAQPIKRNVTEKDKEITTQHAACDTTNHKTH